jgi:phage gpG-like protein
MKLPGGWAAPLDGIARRASSSTIPAIAGYATAVGVPFADSIPAHFRDGGPGWDKPRLREGVAMVDTERLAKSIAYAVRGRTATVGTNVPYGPQLNGDRGQFFTVRAKGNGWLTIPNPAVLTAYEVRHAQAWDFQDAVKLEHGPQGPGIYRKTPVRGFLRLLFRLVKEVTIAARPFLRVSDAGVEFVGQAAQEYVHEGRVPHGIPIRMVGGNPDVGPRKGGRPR